MATEIVTTILSVFTAFLAGVGEGVLSLFDSLILDDLGKLTNFAVWFLVFGAIGMAWGIFMTMFRLLKRR